MLQLRNLSLPTFMKIGKIYVPSLFFKDAGCVRASMGWMLAYIPCQSHDIMRYCACCNSALGYFGCDKYYTGSIFSSCGYFGSKLHTSVQHIVVVVAAVVVA